MPDRTVMMPHVVGTRLTDADRAKLTTLCSHMQRPVSDVLRILIRTAQPVDVPQVRFVPAQRQQQDAPPKDPPPTRVRLEFSQADIMFYLGRMLEQRGYHIDSTAGEWLITPNQDGVGYTVTVYLDAEKK